MARARTQPPRAIGCLSLLIGVLLIAGAAVSGFLAMFSGGESRMSQDLRIIATLGLAFGGIGFGTFGVWKWLIPALPRPASETPVGRRPGELGIWGSDSQERVYLPATVIRDVPFALPVLRVTEPTWHGGEDIGPELMVVRQHAPDGDLAIVDEALDLVRYEHEQGTGICVVPPPDPDELTPAPRTG